MSPSLKKPLVHSVPWLVVVALLLAAEVMVRLLFDPLDAVRYFTNGGLHAHDAEGARTFVGDPDLGWRLRPSLRMNDWLRMPVTTTRDGFRADHEFPRPKRGPRIVCVGDSVTFGYGILAPDQVYPGVLETRLRQRLPGGGLDVVPMGVPAYSSLQGRLWLGREIDTLDPDLVTILFGFNDTAPGVSDARALSTSWVRRSARRLVYRSQALTHLLVGLRPVLSRLGGGPAPYRPRVTTEEYLDNIHAMIGMARARGARVVVIGQVYREPRSDRVEQDRMIAVNRRALAQACARWDVPYLEVPILTEAHAADNGSFFVDGEHPSPLGHRVLAERLLEVIDGLGLLPEVPSATGATAPGTGAAERR